MTDCYKLLRAMRFCLDGSTYLNCRECGYKDKHPNQYCLEALLRDSIFAIEFLIKDRDDWKEAAIKAKEAER